MCENYFRNRKFHRFYDEDVILMFYLEKLALLKYKFPRGSKFKHYHFELSILQESALTLILNNDLTNLSDLLAEISPEKANFPLDEDHWINKPCNQSQNYKTLLHIAIEQKNPEIVKLLIKAGAKADAYNDILGKHSQMNL